MSKRKTTDESGLTLVEILASLVILGIVFVAFMTIFPQMTLFNNRTETKLETMNEARIVLEEYKDMKWKETVLSEARFKSDGDWWTETPDNAPNAIIKIKKTPDEGPPITSELKPGVVRLHKLHVKLMKDDRIISESFGYIQVK
ncbi:type II secretion system protein [Sporosarcina sp. BI001-red]|uniref:PulJ/GspJ family protein n=1 Tax=Sporosarcina sp. BI001-red TaxID=2282866 RepID=UPI000E270495|nr:type II secretion system protein [Sporosarcina sp. BI001-red]REB07165.1 type II secretion system protein [Sporosarcina sp. BI001-red]